MESALRKQLPTQVHTAEADEDEHGADGHLDDGPQGKVGRDGVGVLQDSSEAFHHQLQPREDVLVFEILPGVGVDVLRDQ